MTPLLKWGQQGTGTNQIPPILERVCCPLHPNPTTVRMNINIPSFPVLWPHLPPPGIVTCISYSSNFPMHLCPTSCLPQLFWIVAYLHLSASLVFGVGGLPSSSFPPCYPCCLFPMCCFFISGIATGNKTDSPYGVLGASLDLYGTIIYILNYYTRITLTK